MDVARSEAMKEREAYAAWTKSGATSTLDADELASLESAQALWRVSMEADCLLKATAFKSALTSTIPHIERLKCEAESIAARIEFLRSRYPVLKDSK